MPLLNLPWLSRLVMMATIALTWSATDAFARTVPDGPQKPSNPQTAEKSFEVAKMSEGAKFLIRACIDDMELLELTPRRCVQLIKGILDSQKGALGASLSIDEREKTMMNTCRMHSPSRRGCENLVHEATQWSSKKTSQVQTASFEKTFGNSAR